MSLSLNLNKEAWNNFVTRYAQDGGFLQSWEWGEFQKSAGKKIWRLVVTDAGEIRMAVLIVRQPVKFGFSYLYSPRGPVWAEGDVSGWLKELRDAVTQIAKSEKSLFFRIEPSYEVDPGVLRGAGFRPAPEHMQPKHTLIIDLEKSEEELLAAMKSKTRYNIGIAKKHNVQVRTAQKKSDLAAFYKIMMQTTARQGFGTHSYSYFEKMWDQLQPLGMLSLYLAENTDKQVLGGITVLHWHDTATYLHGGMDEKYRALMAPYLLQWTAMLQAKAKGLKKYDLWGVAPADPEKINKKEEGWAGISRFKTGFATDAPIKEYIGVLDLVYRPIHYWGYKMLKK